jgi:DNA primase
MTVNFTNLDKVFWPMERYSKGDVIAFYEKVAPYLLPRVKDRAEALNRLGSSGLGYLHHCGALMGQASHLRRTQAEDAGGHRRLGCAHRPVLYDGRSRSVHDELCDVLLFAGQLLTNDN